MQERESEPAKPTPTSLTATQVADRMGLTTRHLQDLRLRGIGPPIVQRGLSIHYLLADVQEIERHEAAMLRPEPPPPVRGEGVAHIGHAAVDAALAVILRRGGQAPAGALQDMSISLGRDDRCQLVRIYIARLGIADAAVEVGEQVAHRFNRRRLSVQIAHVRPPILWPA